MTRDPAIGPEGPEDLFEPLERQLYLDVYEALPEAVENGCGISWTEDGAALRLTCERKDHPFFNRIMGVPGGGRDFVTWVREVAEHYERHGVSRWMIQVAPSDLTPAVVETFESNGLVPLRGWAKHAGAVGDVQPPGAAAHCDLRIEAIGLELADQWASVLAPAFGYPEDAVSWPAATVGRPGWTHYLAFDGDEPAATAALFVTNRIGTLGFAATSERHRRRGAQSALIARRIRDAERLELEWLVTETDEELPDRPNPSYHNVVRAGLAVRYVRANWGPPPPGG